MRAVILAAGRGSRMGRLTEERPKCLTEIDGRPLLDWMLEALRGAGLREIAVVRGYRSELLEREGLSYFDNPRWKDTNMVRSLECASDWLRSSDCLVSYGDVLYTGAAVRGAVKTPGELVLPYNTRWLEVWRERFDDPLEDAETFRLDAKGLLQEIGGRPGSVEEVEGQFMGLLKLTPAGWSRIEARLKGMPPRNVDRMDCTSLLQGLLADGLRIKTVPVPGGWFEVDSERDLKACEKRLREGRLWQ